VIEQASVDARRRLVLIRRDGVEHLIMTGGPVDVVIETGIQAPQAERADGRRPRHPPRLHAATTQSRASRQRMSQANFRRQHSFLSPRSWSRSRGSRPPRRKRRRRHRRSLRRSKLHRSRLSPQRCLPQSPRT